MGGITMRSDVIIMSVHARHSRRANRELTDRMRTAAPPWYLRSLPGSAPPSGC
jgi:hypothetical protein